MERMTSRDIGMGRLSAEEAREADRRWRAMSPEDRKRGYGPSVGVSALTGGLAGAGLASLGVDIANDLRRGRPTSPRAAAIQGAALLASPFAGGALGARLAKQERREIEDDEFIRPVVDAAEGLEPGGRLKGVSHGLTQDGRRRVRAVQVLSNPEALTPFQEFKGLFNRGSDKTAALRQRPDEGTKMSSKKPNLFNLTKSDAEEAQRRWESMSPDERKKYRHAVPLLAAAGAFSGSVLGGEAAQAAKGLASKVRGVPSSALSPRALRAAQLGGGLLMGGGYAALAHKGNESVRTGQLWSEDMKSRMEGLGDDDKIPLKGLLSGNHGRAMQLLRKDGKEGNRAQDSKVAMSLLEATKVSSASGLHMQEKLRQRPDGSYYTETREVMDSLGQARAAAAFKAMSPEERKALTEHIPAGGKVLGGLGGGLAGGGLGYLAVEAAKPKSAPVALGLLGGGALLGAVLGGKAGGKLGRDEQERRVSTGTFPVSPTSVTGANALRRLYAIEEAERAEKLFGKQASAEDTLSLGLHGWSRGL